MNKQQNLTDIEKFFLALADKTRLRILNLMGDEEICVGFLVEVLNESQPKISRHLAYLRGAGIVETRREGKQIFYKIAASLDDYNYQVLRDILLWLQSQKQMKSDYENFSKISDDVSNSVELSNNLPSDIFADAYPKKSRSHEMEVFLL